MAGLDDYLLRKVREHGREGPVTFIDEPEPERILCPIISADDHALEPADMFSKRVPAKFSDRVPYLGPGEDGAPWWVIGDAQVPILLTNGASGRPMDEWGITASNFDEFRPAVYDSRARLRDMDMCGVWAQLCFGSLIWGFAGTRFSTMSDREAGLVSLRAYNQWMLEEWCGADLNRYIPCQLPWLADAEVAAKEIHANAERGFKAVSFSENPENLGFDNVYNRSWDPFFRACEETNTVINLHVGSSGKTAVPSTSSAEEVITVLFPVSGLEALADWVYSGVLFRFPGLKIALSEAGCSWVPMALERFRRSHRQAGGTGRGGWPMDGPTPMDIVRRNFVFTSIEDPAAFRMLDIIGEDNVMVETDYPHFDSTWPTCQGMLRTELLHLDAATIRKVCFENAARVYRHPLPPREWIADSEVGLPTPVAV